MRGTSGRLQRWTAELDSVGGGDSGEVCSSFRCRLPGLGRQFDALFEITAARDRQKPSAGAGFNAVSVPHTLGAIKVSPG